MDEIIARLGPVAVAAIDAAIAALQGAPALDCSFEEGGRYPRDYGRSEDWEIRPCAGIYLSYQRVRFDPPVRRGDAVRYVEASGMARWNDTPTRKRDVQSPAGVLGYSVTVLEGGGLAPITLVQQRRAPYTTSTLPTADAGWDAPAEE